MPMATVTNGVGCSDAPLVQTGFAEAFVDEVHGLEYARVFSLMAFIRQIPVASSGVDQ